MATSDWMSLQKYQVQNATTPPMTSARIVMAKQHVHALLHAPRQMSPQSSLHRFPQQHMCTVQRRARTRPITQYIAKCALLSLRSLLLLRGRLWLLSASSFDSASKRLERAQWLPSLARSTLPESDRPIPPKG